MNNLYNSDTKHQASWYDRRNNTRPVETDIACDTSFDWYLSEEAKQGVTYDMESTPTVLVGLGPHSRRIYMHYLRQMGKAPKLIVELKSRKKFVKNFLYTNKLKSEVLYISDENCNSEELSRRVERELGILLSYHNITHAIISTEPKAHKAYLKFFLEKKLRILTDKPITSPLHVADDLRAAQQVWDDFTMLRDLYTQGQKNGAFVDVQCQRRYHPAYQFIRDQLNQVVGEFGIPITYVDSYHCDGMWNMPDEFMNRENHPYKYGYGKLCHSGYHFVDLVAWLLKANDQLEDKRPDHFSLYASETRPNDALGVINKDDYKALFNSDKLDGVFDEHHQQPIEATGEVDFHALIQFKQKHRIMTTVHLGLMQSGYSRRSWMDLPEDTYKSNGRIRHERLNIQVGPLMNIQVHSYQSKEVKERNNNDKCGVGSLEHFDVLIFRNVDLIGGKPFEKFTAQDLMTCNGATGQFIGFNEQARENCLARFLANKPGESDLLDHALTVKLMQKSYEALSARYLNHSPVVTSPMV